MVRSLISLLIWLSFTVNAAEWFEYCAYRTSEINVFSDQIKSSECRHVLSSHINVINLDPVQSVPKTPYVVRSNNTPIIEFEQPINDQAIRSNDGGLEVNISVKNLELTDMHQVQLLVNDKVAATQSDGAFRLSNLARGSYTLKVNILFKGKLIASSEEIRVHMLRTSILFRPQ